MIRRQLRRKLYTLRRRFGIPIDHYSVTVGTPDYELGTSDATVVKTNFPLAITMSVTSKRDFEYDLGYVKANSNFVYGGFFEVGDRLVIVETDITIEQRDYFIIEGKRYSIQTLGKIDHNVGYVFHLRMTKGVLPNQIIEKSVIQKFVITDEPAIQ